MTLRQIIGVAVLILSAACESTPSTSSTPLGPPKWRMGEIEVPEGRYVRVKANRQMPTLFTGRYSSGSLDFIAEGPTTVDISYLGSCGDFVAARQGDDFDPEAVPDWMTYEEGIAEDGTVLHIFRAECISRKNHNEVYLVRRTREYEGLENLKTTLGGVLFVPAIVIACGIQQSCGGY
ncbi:MAG: hypothetical protein AAFR65_00375 [Pseudomonadota bacterium]